MMEFRGFMNFKFLFLTTFLMFSEQSFYSAANTPFPTTSTIRSGRKQLKYAPHIKIEITPNQLPPIEVVDILSRNNSSSPSSGPAQAELNLALFNATHRANTAARVNNQDRNINQQQARQTLGNQLGQWRAGNA